MMLVRRVGQVPETILVVEDESTLRDVLQDMLRASGFRVVSAANGKEGLSEMGRSKPHLVVSDIGMPVMDGYRFYEEVRARPEWVNVPFIFLTGSSDEGDLRHSRRLGADDFLVKPVSEVDLVTTVRARLERRAALEAAREAQVTEIRRTILRTLNHELRTPLTYLSGYADLLRELGPELSAEKIRAAVDGILAGSQRLAVLVEDMVVLVDLQTGAARSGFERERRRIEDIKPLLEKVVAAEQARAQARNVNLEARLSANLPAVLGQRDLLADAVRRLLDNAIKFSKKDGGHVTLRAQATDRGLTLEVRDTGIGMPEEELGRIAEMFYQIDRAFHEQRGPGVGLTIVSGLVALHGGELTVTSELGTGSTARIDLPAAPPD
jgi:two-component system, sensor histidine kinase and response regulator